MSHVEIQKKKIFSFYQMAVLAGASVLLALLLLQPASAGNTAFQQAFEHSFNNPADIDAALSYAEEAVKIGDYESAIPPLERILMFNPKLTDVRLEVGILYYLLNSNDVARKHLNDVVQDKEASPQTMSRAQSYLVKL